MTILVRHQSRGLPVAIALDGPARRLFERGKELWYLRRGLLDPSCAHCCEQNLGARLRADLFEPGPQQTLLRFT